MATRTQRSMQKALWPDCRGAMAALIRTSQWRVSPLGAIETWPQALKTAVEIMLHSRQPAYVCWGRALTTLYNDAAIALIGARHPHALGRPYGEVFPDTWDDIKPVIDAALAGEAQHVVGQRISHGEHPASWYAYTWTPLGIGDGRIGGLYCVATETSLTIGDEQLRTVLENACDAVSMLDLASGRYVFISPSHIALTGFSEEELKAFTPAAFLERLHPEDVDKLRHPKLGQDGAFEGTSEYRWKVKSGVYRWFSVSRKLVRDDGGRPVALVNVNRDVTERKRAELEMLASRATLEAALSSMTDAVYIADSEGRFLQVNHSFATFHRYTSIEECAGTFTDFVRDFDVSFPDCSPAAPEDRPVARALRGESAVGAEYSLVRKSTGESWIGSYSFGPIRDDSGAITGAVVTARDITEQKRAEMDIRAARAMLEAALHSMTDGVCITDTKGHILQANAAFAAYHRYHGGCPDNFADIINDFEMFFPDGYPAPVELRSVARALRGETGVGVEYVLRRKDTGESWTGSYSFGPIRDSFGAITGAVLTARDVTDAKRAAEALKDSEARLNLAVESAQMGTWEWNLTTDEVVWNTKLYELLDLAPHKRKSVDAFFERVHPDDLPDIRQSLDTVIAGGRDWRAEFRIVRDDASIRWLVSVGRVFRHPEGAPRAMLGVCYDITEEKRAEAELKRSEARTQSLKDQLMHVGRVSELSQVSAGIAHELNQPLAAMLNYATTAKRLIAQKDLASIEAAALSIARAGEQAIRAGTIVRRMRDFVEKRDTNRTPDDINAIVREAADLGLIGAKADGIEIALDLEPTLPPATVDRVQIEQVLVNLMHNAIDAMAGCAIRRLALSTKRIGRGIEVSVTDTGTGIAQHLEEKLFLPFNTTKPTGMGIGLAISRTIIEAHGGDITAQSTDGTTTFRFTVPVA
jgi:PAS domain S-box-containing protein